MTATTRRRAEEARKIEFLSRADDAHADLRRVCNGMKRMSHLAAAALVSKASVEAMHDAAGAAAIKVLHGLGVRPDDQTRLGGSMAMVMEPMSSAVAEAVLRGLSVEEAGGRAAGLARSVVDASKAKWIATAVEARWPHDEMPDTLAIRLAYANALSLLIAELVVDDLGIDNAKILKEAAKSIIGTSTLAANAVAPDGTAPTSRLMAIQTMLLASGRVYAAGWRSQAERIRKSRGEAALRDPAEQEEFLSRVGATFSRAFERVVDLAGSMPLLRAGDEAPAREPRAPAIRSHGPDPDPRSAPGDVLRSAPETGAPAQRRAASIFGDQMGGA